jgi:hypothetical protein
MPRPAKTTIRPIQIAVSRIAGPSERAISSFIRLRGTALRNHSPPARPASTAAWFSGPERLYRSSRSLPTCRPPLRVERPSAPGVAAVIHEPQALPVTCCDAA